MNPRPASVGFSAERLARIRFQPNGFYQFANDFRVAAYQAIVD